MPKAIVLFTNRNILKYSRRKPKYHVDKFNVRICFVNQRLTAKYIYTVLQENLIHLKDLWYEFKFPGKLTKTNSEFWKKASSVCFSCKYLCILSKLQDGNDRSNKYQLSFYPGLWKRFIFVKDQVSDAVTMAWIRVSH